MNILIINGPNLNLLGRREPDIYGSISMENYLKKLKKDFKEHDIFFFQSNTEGELISRLQEENYDALVLNMGAYTHYSYAISDCLKNIDKPKIEVHISNLYKREKFRQKSLTAPYTDAIISGAGLRGYWLAIKSWDKNLG
ncbi:MAG: 3-dehydroquinate dehydratase [Bergeyella sp.]|nr:3-dehydroquinate dehydratase [Bergeyella sp.]